jgi:hypothetical protein
VRRPGSKHFSRGFLIVAPGLTIRDLEGDRGQMEYRRIRIRQGAVD